MEVFQPTVSTEALVSHQRCEWRSRAFRQPVLQTLSLPAGAAGNLEQRAAIPVKCRRLSCLNS